MMYFILFGNDHITLPRLMAAAIASDSRPANCQIFCTAFIEVLTLADDQLIKDLTATYPLNYIVNSKGVLTLSHMAFPFWLYFC